MKTARPRPSFDRTQDRAIAMPSHSPEQPNAPLAPGATIGILGGGQLGRMLAMSAARLGFRVAVYADGADQPASQVCATTTVAAFDDAEALERFAAQCAVVTFEFENVPAAAVERIARTCPVRPGVAALGATQDRLEERALLLDLGVPVAEHRKIDCLADLTAALSAFGAPLVLKSRRFGYDGKGQARVIDADAAATAFATIGSVPAIAEVMIPFAREVSVIAVRGCDGQMAFYPLGENVHRDGILRTTTAPAERVGALTQSAMDIARAFGEATHYVGTFGIEFFEVADADGATRLIVNEIAPRVHNTGHWTLEGAVVDQFENHVRAIAGWPLGETRALGQATMTNLIGDEAVDWAKLSACAGLHLHLYGKADIRPGRKMGHVTRVTPFATA